MGEPRSVSDAHLLRHRSIIQEAAENTINDHQEPQDTSILGRLTGSITRIPTLNRNIPSNSYSINNDGGGPYDDEE